MIAIEAAPRRGGAAVSVRLRSGRRFVISPAQLSRMALAAGDSVDADTAAGLVEAALELRTERRLLRLLAGRARSRAELEHRLAEWEVPPELGRRLLDRLHQAGLLDDSRMARELSESLARRGHGSLRAAHDLLRLGVDGEAAAAAVEGHRDRDLAAAQALVITRFGAPPYDPRTARRASGLLARRGFDADTAAAALAAEDLYAGP